MRGRRRARQLVGTQRRVLRGGGFRAGATGESGRDAVHPGPRAVATADRRRPSGGCHPVGERARRQPACRGSKPAPGGASRRSRCTGCCTGRLRNRSTRWRRVRTTLACCVPPRSRRTRATPLRAVPRLPRAGGVWRRRRSCGTPTRRSRPVNARYSQHAAPFVGHRSWRAPTWPHSGPSSWGTCRCTRREPTVSWAPCTGAPACLRPCRCSRAAVAARPGRGPAAMSTSCACADDPSPSGSSSASGPRPISPGLHSPGSSGRKLRLSRHGRTSTGRRRLRAGCHADSSLCLVVAVGRGREPDCPSPLAQIRSARHVSYN